MKINGQVVHADVTLDAVIEGVKSEMFGMENPGFCLACGAEAGGCEPDARRYECECCGESQVYGAEEILLEMA